MVNPVLPEYAAKAFGHVHLTSIEPGAIRGNHRHRQLTELSIVWGGRSHWRVEADCGAEDFELQASELSLVEIPPGVGHAVKNADNHVIYLLAYYDRPFDADHPDSEPCPLLP